MLQVMRQYGNSWPVKIILGLIVLSFGVFWGIGDMVRFGGPDISAATVGEKKISLRAFATRLELQARQLMAENGGVPSQAVLTAAAGVTLQEMIGHTLFLIDAHNLGLSAPDDLVRKALEAQPEFQDARGRFDPKLFYKALEHLGRNEKAFVADFKEDLLINQIIGAVRAPVPFPKAFLDASDVYWDKPLKVEVLAIPYRSQLKDYKPTEEELTQFYTDHQSQYFLPEKRSFQLIVFAPKSASADDIDAERAAKKQVGEIEDALAEGIALEEVIKKFGLSLKTHTDLTQESASKAGLSPAVIEHAFTLEEGEEMPFERTAEGAFQSIRVTQVIPEAAPPLAEILPKVRADFISATQQIATNTLGLAILKAVNNQGGSFSNEATIRGLRTPEVLSHSRMQMMHDTGLPENLREHIATLPVGQAQIFDVPSEKFVLVIRLQHAPNAKTSGVRSIKAEEWTNHLALPEFLILYKEALAAELGVHVNAPLIARVVGQMAEGQM